MLQVQLGSLVLFASFQRGRAAPTKFVRVSPYLTGASSAPRSFYLGGRSRQFAEGSSARTTTSRSAASVRASSFSPSCCCSAVKIEIPPASAGCWFAPLSAGREFWLVSGVHSKWKSYLSFRPVISTTGLPVCPSERNFASVAISTPTALSTPLPNFAFSFGSPVALCHRQLLRPPLRDDQGKDGHRCRLSAKLQLKAIGQQALQTQSHWLVKYEDLVRRHSLRITPKRFLRSRRQIESFRSDPSGPARELIVAYVVSDLNQKTQRGISNEQLPAGRKIDFQTTIRGARLDRRNFKLRQRGCRDRLLPRALRAPAPGSKAHS